MDRDRVQGKTENLVGNVKEAAGKVTGDQELEAEGIGDQAKGHLHDAVGSIKDGAREIVDSLRRP